MKRLILTSALLSLILLIAQPMRAQVKVLSSSFEVAKSNFLFSGHSAQFELDGYILEMKGNLNVSPASTPSNTADVNGSLLTPNPTLFISAPKNKLAIGSASNLLYSVHATDLYSYNCNKISDRRYKSDIEDLAFTMDKIMRLRPVKFNYREEKDGERSTDPRRLNRVGLIAQELLEVIPEAVSYLEEDDIYTVDYTTLIPFLIKTAQEQQVFIENQQALIENQQLQIEELQMALIPDNAAFATPTFSSAPLNGNATETMEAVGNKLWSNVPNPFKQETHIRYALTEDVREAQLCIYDLSGRQLSCHRLNDRGESEFVLRAATLNPGIYLYSLIADGKVVDTHRMVVTE